MKTPFTYRLFALLILFSGLSGLASAQDTGMRFFKGDLSAALAQAKSEGKMLFVDAYTDWCGPCKLMAANTFPDAEVGAFYNANFINYQLDMEKGEGPAFAKRYGVTVFPTLLFLDGEGRAVDQYVGRRDPKAFVELGKKVLQGGYATLADQRAQFQQGSRDRSFLYNLLMGLAESRQPAEQVLAEFKPGMAGEALLDSMNWNVFVRYIKDPAEAEFRYFEQHLDAFKAKYGAEAVTEKLASGYLYVGYGAAEARDEAAYQAALARLRQLDAPMVKVEAENLVLEWLMFAQDWAGYVKQANRLIKKFDAGDPISLDTYARTLYDGTTDPAMRKQALAYAEQSVKKLPRVQNLTTKALLLYALGRKADAIATGEAAQAICKAKGKDCSEIDAAMQTWK
jgi:thiol-disulfide isomerase/thioredoxin